jgi:hypothetical protein
MHLNRHAMMSEGSGNDWNPGGVYQDGSHIRFPADSDQPVVGWRIEEIG